MKVSRMRSGACLALLVLAGCATDVNIRRAIEEVNAEFKKQYEEILATQGAREFRVPAGETFAAVQKVLAGLNMRVESRDPELGYLGVAALAPAPLTDAEWKEVAKADLPMMQRLAARHIGLPAYFISFEPEGLEIVINVTVIPEGRHSEVSLTMRMRQIKPPASGMPRREYAPPTGVRLGLDKIWDGIERELKVKSRAL